MNSVHKVFSKQMGTRLKSIAPRYRTYFDFSTISEQPTCSQAHQTANMAGLDSP